MSDPREQPPPREPLDYEPPSHGIQSTPAQKLAGVLLACPLILGSVFLSFVIAYGQPGGWPFLLAVATVLALCVGAIALRKSRYPGLAQGIWIGIGIALLIEGACFLVNR